ncbi:MAG: hypothetical protein ABWZ27_12970, partial [Aestuariivirgaceae bacterium]
ADASLPIKASQEIAAVVSENQSDVKKALDRFRKEGGSAVELWTYDVSKSGSPTFWPLDLSYLGSQLSDRRFHRDDQREVCRLFQQLRAYDRPALPLVSGPPTGEGWINEIKQ